jgi:LAS superfamily LD-carboxypeptidase LdcB
MEVSTSPDYIHRTAQLAVAAGIGAGALLLFPHAAHAASSGTSPDMKLMSDGATVKQHVPETADVSPEIHTFTVEKNQTLWGIVKAQYGEVDASLVQIIAEQNGIKNPSLIFSGEKIQLFADVNSYHTAALHVIKAGDTMWSQAYFVAAANKTIHAKALEQVKAANKSLLTDALTIGSPLLLPASAKDISTAKQAFAAFVSQVPTPDTPPVNTNTQPTIPTPSSVSPTPAPATVAPAPETTIAPIAPVVIAQEAPPTPVTEVAPAPTTTVAPAEQKPTAPLPAPEVAPTPEKVKEVPSIATIGPIGGFPAERIQTFVSRLITVHGFTAKGAAFLVGSGMQESGLNVSDGTVGDKGTAFGWLQWRGGRAEGMPHNDVAAQIDFAVTEMQRDSIASAHHVLETFRDPNATIDQLKWAVAYLERYQDYQLMKDGVVPAGEGNRFIWAEQILAALSTSEQKPQVLAPTNAPPQALNATIEGEPSLVVADSVRTEKNGIKTVIVDDGEPDGKNQDRLQIDVAQRVSDLIEAAKKDGITLTITSGFRTKEKQIAAREANGCPDIMNSPPEDCVVPTAKPGTSMHEAGQAVDFGENRGGLSRNAFQWLSAHAAEYGLKNLASEPWHWSTTGK